MTKAEHILMAGLAEARADMAFIRAHTEDVAMRKMLEAALKVSGLYLQDGIDLAFANHIMEQEKGTK